MPFYGDEELARVREASDLAQIVGQYAPLRPRGRELWCCCPLHHEKTPSFKINPATQSWHCFGCGEGGDVFSFVMKMQDLNFSEAVEWLAERAHLELKGTGRGSRTSSGQKERLRRICTATADFYHLQLMRGKSSGAAAAREYLKSRGMGGRVPNDWMLGFAPGNFTLLRHLQAAGFSAEDMVAANVVTRGDNGKLRDRFFNRVIFPINDVSGQCIGFGGRVLGEGNPKYLNSQEGPLFHKSSVLYGLDHAKAAMTATGEAIVVEGYTDVIALSEAGIKNVVATMGTALTQSHIRLLSRHAGRRIIYLFDGDAAGQRAADRALGFLDESMTPEAGARRIALDAVVLPDDLDPADFVGTRGAEPLKELLAGAQPLIKFGIERRLAAHDLTSAEGRSAALADALSVLAPIKDSLLAKDYAVQIAARTHARETDVLERLATLKSPPAWQERPEQQPQPAARPRRPRDNRWRMERAYLGLLSTHPLMALSQAQTLTSLRWQYPEHRQWSKELLLALAENPSVDAAELMSRLLHRVEGSEGALSAAVGCEGERADKLCAYLENQLVSGDLADAIASLRDRMARSDGLSSEDYEKLFAQAVALQQDLNARRKARPSMQ